MDTQITSAGTIGAPIGNDRLLGIEDVATILDVCPVTASCVMKESGRSIVLHRRVYILETNLLAYLHEQEAGHVAR